MSCLSAGRSRVCLLLGAISQSLRTCCVQLELQLSTVHGAALLLCSVCQGATMRSIRAWVCG